MKQVITSFFFCSDGFLSVKLKLLKANVFPFEIRGQNSGFSFGVVIMLEFIVFAITITILIVNSIALAYPSLDSIDLSNTDILDDLDSNLWQNMDTVASTLDDPCVSEMPQDTSQIFQDISIHDSPSNDIVKKNQVCAAKGNLSGSKIQKSMLNYDPRVKLPEPLSKSDFQPMLIDGSFVRYIRDQDAGCEQYRHLPFRLTCGGPEVAHINMETTSTNFVINCIREIASEIPKRFWYPATRNVAGYCCAYFKNAVSTPGWLRIAFDRR